MVSQNSISQYLARAEAQFRQSPVSDLAMEWRRLRTQLDEPCEVAIVGAVKRGKSTLLNALLGADLAQTGSTETTATINYFRYGTPDPAKPVKCYWRNGTVTDESQQFLNELQGNDITTLRRADAIEKLEFTLPHDFLRNVTLVDTPGTGAVVDQHQNRTAEYLQLASHLRERHDAESRRIGGSADAVIYALDVVGRDNDRKFLEEYQGNGKTGEMGPYNAIGVVTKIDLNADALRGREKVRTQIASQFKDVVSAVVTVSGGVQRHIDILLSDSGKKLHDFMGLLKRIPHETLTLLLQNERIAAQLPLPLTDAERAELLSYRDWQVFVTLVHSAIDTNFDATVFTNKAQEIAGFEPLRRLLQNQFLERGRHLRWRRIMQTAKKIIEETLYFRIKEVKALEQSKNEKLARYERLLGGCRDQVVVEELRSDLKEWLSLGDEKRIKSFCESLAGECSSLLRELSEINDDYEALKCLRDDAAHFNSEELAELDMVLGRFGLEYEKRVPDGFLSQSYLSERMLAWQAQKESYPTGSIGKRVANRAWVQYGNMLAYCLHMKCQI